MGTDSPHAVVFDLDGLMFNTEDLYRRGGGEVLRRRGKPYEEALFLAMMGRPAKVALQVMIDWHGLTDSVETLERESYEVMVPLMTEHLAPMPGLFDLLAALDQAGRPKAIATSSRRIFVETILNRFELLPRFDFILTSEDVTHGKPHPEIYAKACQRLELTPPQVMVLEDSHTGCQAAVAAGVVAVAVPDEYCRQYAFPGAAFIAQGLADRRIYETLGLS